MCPLLSAARWERPYLPYRESVRSYPYPVTISCLGRKKKTTCRLWPHGSGGYLQNNLLLHAIFLISSLKRLPSPISRYKKQPASVIRRRPFFSCLGVLYRFQAALPANSHLIKSSNADPEISCVILKRPICNRDRGCPFITVFTLPSVVTVA